MIDSTTFVHLANLSKIDFCEESQVRFAEDLNLIADFVSKVTEFDGSYDDISENKQISFSDLREDVAISTATPEQLLNNTESENNCYIIPRVID